MRSSSSVGRHKLYLEAKSWRLSSDTYDSALPGGYSTHGDWFNGWKPEFMDSFVKNCAVDATNAAICQTAIDLAHHHGIHPRVGAVDIAPIVFLGLIILPTMVRILRECGHTVGGLHQE